MISLAQIKVRIDHIGHLLLDYYLLLNQKVKLWLQQLVYCVFEEINQNKEYLRHEYMYRKKENEMDFFRERETYLATQNMLL